VQSALDIPPRGLHLKEFRFGGQGYSRLELIPRPLRTGDIAAKQLLAPIPSITTLSFGTVILGFFTSLTSSILGFVQRNLRCLSLWETSRLALRLRADFLTINHFVLGAIQGLKKIASWIEDPVE
jgi:hypothetical protein